MPSDHDPMRMHPEMIPLVDALDRLPGVTTHASCTGKDGRGMWVTFQIENLPALTPLAYCLDPSWWRVAWEPEPEDPSFFSLEAKRPGQHPPARKVVERIDEWLK